MRVNGHNKNTHTLQVIRDDAFSQSHPLVNFVFYAGVLGVTMFCLHPVVLATSFLTALTYGCCVKGWRHVGRLMVSFVIPGFLIVAVLNPAFNHNGVTLLLTLPDGNSVTLEAIVYGIVLASVLAASVVWFVSANAVLTRDKFTHSVGRVFATGALIITLSFRFIPLFTRQFKATLETQRFVGRDIHAGKVRAKVGIALNVTSALFTWSLENAIHVSDSMRVRGYGLHRRTSYSLYRWNRRGLITLTGEIVLLGLTIASMVAGGLHAGYDPVITVSGISGAPTTAWTVVGMVAFGLFELIPLFMRAEESLRWARYEKNQVRLPQASSSAQPRRRNYGVA